MRIGELIQRVGTTARTVRYYEALGLLGSPEYEKHEQHQYSETTVARLKKIEQLQNLGLSLEEIRGVIDWYFIDPSGKEAKSRVLEILRQHLGKLDQKAAEISQLRSELTENINRFEQWLAQNSE